MVDGVAADPARQHQRASRAAYVGYVVGPEPSWSIWSSMRRASPTAAQYSVELGPILRRLSNSAVIPPRRP